MTTVLTYVSLLFFWLIFRIESVVVDLSIGSPLETGRYWLENGFIDASDSYWTTVTSMGSSFVNPVIFTSLSDIGGSIYTSGIPT